MYTTCENRDDGQTTENHFIRSRIFEGGHHVSFPHTHSPSTGHVMGMAKAWHVRRARASSGNTQGMINGSINESMSEEEKKKKGQN